MLITSCDANTSDNGITWWGKSFFAPNFCPLDLRNAMMPLTSCNTDSGTNGIMWSYDQKHFTDHFDYLDVWKWSLWQCWWYHVMPKSLPMAYHDQKSHAAPHFNHLDLKNAMILLQCHHHHMLRLLFDIRNAIASSASYDTYTNVIGIIWPGCTSFQLPWPKKWNYVTFQCHWHHVNPTLVPMAKHAQSHVSPHLIIVI